MKKGILFCINAFLVLLIFNGFAPVMPGAKNIVFTDSVTTARGEAVFNKFCTGCHNFRQDGIGPQLGGVTTIVSAQWMRRFITNPQKTINSGDKRAQQLLKKFKTVMPSFSSLAGNDLNALITFLGTQKMPDFKDDKSNGKEISNPIPDAIKLSNLVVNMQLVTQFPASCDSCKLPRARITKWDLIFLCHLLFHL